MPPPGAGLPEQNQSSFTAAVADSTLSEALLTLRKRRWILVAGVLLGLLLGVYRAVTRAKIYEAAGRIQVRAGASNEYKISSVLSSMNDDTSKKMLTEIEILKSDTLLLKVARDLDLANNPDFLLNSKEPQQHVSLDTPTVRQKTLHQLQSNLLVTLIPKTDIIRISYPCSNGKLSADIVNQVISDYVNRSFVTRYESQQRVSKWLAGTLDGLKRDVEQSQQQMMDSERRLGILAFDPTHSLISTSLEDLSKATGEAKMARITAESRYRALHEMDPNAIEGSSASAPGTMMSALNSLRVQLATLKSNYALMVAGTLGPNNSQAVAARAQIDELTKEIETEQNRLLLQAKENYTITKETENQTTAVLEAQKSDAYKLRDDLVEYTVRKREFDANRTLYDSLQERLHTASVEAGLEALEIDVVDQAIPPATPDMKPLSTIFLTSLAFGVIGGIVVAFLLDSLDTGMTSIAEVESVTQLPSLAIVPRGRRTPAEQSGTLTTAQRNLAILTQPKSQFAEAFRSLRTSLLLSSTGHPPKLIVLTSATPSEGKTTTSTNLAAILAQQESRVLLIDGDLRRPNVHHRLGMNGKAGLTTVLTGATKLEDAVQSIPELPNLDVLPSGPIPPFPAEMLSSEAMKDLVKHCLEIYDYVLIDSPPVLSVTDGVILARMADAVVFVIRHGKSSKHVVRRARDLLIRSGASIAGIVLNAVDMNSPDYYGYYGYSGYSYSSVDSDSWESQPEADAGTKKTGKGE